jgi:hypothetical protein
MLDLAAVDARVAHGAECDQILTRIITGLAAKLFVVNFEIGHGSARLTFPAVAVKHLVAKLVVCRWIQPHRSKLRWSIHDAFPIA